MQSEPIKVLYDITTLAEIHGAESSPTGIFRATEAMGQALRTTDGIDLYLGSTPIQADNAIGYLSKSPGFDSSRFVAPADPVRPTLAWRALRRAVGRGPWRESVDRFNAQLCRSDRAYERRCFDIYHVNWRGERHLPSAHRAQIVLTVFDLIALKRPDWFVKTGQFNEVGAYLRRLLTSVRAHHQLTVNTEWVKHDVLTLFPHVSAEQVSVVPLGVSSRFHPREKDEIDRVRDTYGIKPDHRYVLCVNTLEPRKNMGAAVRAFGEVIRSRRAEDVILVLAGAKGWLWDDLQKLVGVPVRDGTVVVTGYVDDADLPSLYAGASLFCYPSLDEGFGLPVLEAMRSGVPVITSDRGALREVTGEAGLLVDPTDASGLAAAMWDLLNDDARAADLTRKGRARAEQFTWQRSAAALRDVYRKAVLNQHR